MFEQIEWVQCEDRMPHTPESLNPETYLVTVWGWRKEKTYVTTYRYCCRELRGKSVVRWEGPFGVTSTPPPIAWAKMPTGWKDGNDG